MENELRPDVPPIAAPTGDVATSPVSLRDTPVDLRALALWHRRMLFVLFFSCITDALFVSVRPEDVEHAEPTQFLLYMAVLFAALVMLLLRIVTVFKVAQVLKTFWPWLAAFLSVWGCIGFFVILSLNKIARIKLRVAGFRVGFWGVKLKKAPT